MHGGWFVSGKSATAYRHLVGHIAAKAGTSAFVPDYRLAPEHPFPAAVDDVLATYRGMDGIGIRRMAITGDSAGGNLALVLASRIAAKAVPGTAVLVGVVALSPVTDLTLSGATYETRADADLYFTKQQVADLVHAYLGSADANDPLASPLQGRFSGLLPSAFTSATTRCCWMTHDDTWNVLLPPGSMRGLTCGRACPMVSRNRKNQGVRTGAGRGRPVSH